MAETYCGKSCGECESREMLNCPGCKVGPGRQLHGDCELARCCRTKGHETCDTCGFKGNCGTLRGKDHMPAYRRRKAEAQASYEAAILQRAPLLGKWLWVMFWIIIVYNVIHLFTNESVIKLIPQLYWPGILIGTLCTAAIGLIFLLLSGTDDHYRIAGIYTVISAGVQIMNGFFSGMEADAGWTLLISIPALIVTFIGKYHQFVGHETVLTGVDNRLADNWINLWKWYLITFGVTMGSLLLVFVVPVIAVLLTLAGAIGAFVVGILEIVYLYKTASCFRNYTSAIAQKAE